MNSISIIRGYFKPTYKVHQIPSSNKCCFHPCNISIPFHLKFDDFAVHCSISNNLKKVTNTKHIPSEINKDIKLKIAVVGFGNYGQFLAKEMVKQGHQVMAYSRSDYTNVAQDMSVHYFSDACDLFDEHPQVILMCTSILSTEVVLRSLPLHRLRPTTIFADILPVKEFPRSLFLQFLPKDFGILCTHPMFSPNSAKDGWAGLTFMLDKVRVGSDPTQATRVEAFLDIFRNAGCRMVEMTCEEHDKHAAGSEFITHMMGRVLEKVGLRNTPIDTKGYESLLNLVENTGNDSFELFLYNENSMMQLERLDWAFKEIKSQLYAYMHDHVRERLMFESHNDQNKGENKVFKGTNYHLDKRLVLPNRLETVLNQKTREDLVVNERH